MVELREHQAEVLNQLRSGVILQGGVGSGKSITALAYYYTYILNGSIKPLTKPKKKVTLCIITTAQKRDKLEWDNELQRFSLSKHKEASISGIKVIIDSWNNIGKYTTLENAFFIFDEQRLIGSGAWAKAFLKITKKNQWILLTATPGDTWMDYVPVFIANGYFKNRTEFIIKHVVYSRYSKYPKIERYINCEQLIRYRDEIVVPMAYHHKIKINRTVIQTDYNKKLWDKVTKKRWNVYKERPIRQAGELAHAQRRVVNSDPSRLIVTKELYQTHNKMIVFYNFDYELFALRTMCEDNKIPYSEWNGHRHDPLPTGEQWLYLVQYTAGAEGWNCITTNAMLLFSQNYSYKIKVQAEGRINRMNTPFEELYYYEFRSETPIDKSIALALDNKRSFNEREYESSFA